MNMWYYLEVCNLILNFLCWNILAHQKTSKEKFFVHFKLLLWHFHHWYVVFWCVLCKSFFSYSLIIIFFSVFAWNFLLKRIFHAIERFSSLFFCVEWILKHEIFDLCWLTKNILHPSRLTLDRIFIPTRIDTILLNCRKNSVNSMNFTSLFYERTRN